MTLSRLFSASKSAGVPHSEISMVANNSDSWFNTDKKVDRDRDGVDDRAEGAGKGAGIGAGVVGGTAGLLAGLGLLAIPGLGPLSQGCVGWPRLALGVVAAAGQPLAVLSERSPRLAFRQRMLTPTQRASVVEARLCSAQWLDTDRSRLELNHRRVCPST